MRVRDGEGVGVGGGGAKRLLQLIFFPVISTNVGFSPKNFLIFSYNSFATNV